MTSQSQFDKKRLKEIRLALCMYSKNLEFPHLSTLIVVISIGCLLLAVGFLLALSALLDGFTMYHTTAYYHIITMINMNCALWYINCRAIGNASTAVADSFQKDIDKYCTAYIVAHYRILWLELSELLQKLGNAYARTYSTYSLFMITNITIAVYGFTSEVIDHGITFSFKEMGLLVDTVYCSVLLFVFCDCSHQTSNKIADRVQTALLEIKLNTVDADTSREIQLFLKAIHLNPPKVSLQGYTVVNRELVTSVIVSIAIFYDLKQWVLTRPCEYVPFEASTRGGLPPSSPPPPQAMTPMALGVLLQWQYTSSSYYNSRSV
ncbi:hypothetical protein NQ317_010367 [Molorchus minor]|uniref:Gustatory receptor n=1 Tax=Molorchus minor TaxID=1323400 RepID=A0ABQ9JG31_9CUCU|nr:hypothetical protein NQ317_010367 [Molorchus minor]